MSGLKQLRNRVKSIRSTQKITRAMKVVSAAKLKRIKEKAERLNDYAKVLGNIIRDLSHSTDLFKDVANEHKIFSTNMQDKPHLMIVITSQRGLCGAFNSSLVRLAKQGILDLQQNEKQIKMIVIGQKGHDALKLQYKNLIMEHYDIITSDYEPIVLQLKDKIMHLIQNDEIGSCSVYYNYFKNALIQVPSSMQVLPVATNKQEDKLKITDKNSYMQNENFAKYEYDGDRIIEKALEMYIGGQMEYAILQSKASEEGARMTAMDNASKNAGELIEQLTLQLNRSRQSMITTELIEIIAGAEAV